MMKARGWRCEWGCPSMWRGSGQKEAYYLGFYPGLPALFATGWFTLRHVSTVMDDVACVAQEHREEVEERVIAVLQPTHPDQQMISVRTAHRRVKKIVTEIQPDAAPIDPGEVRTEDGVAEEAANLKFDTRQENRTIAVLDMPRMEGVLVEKAVHAAVKKHACTMGEALLRLICGQAKVSVTMNLHKNTADPAQDIFAEGGWLSQAAGEKWMGQVTHLAAPGCATAQGYKPTEAIKAAVAGRDGHCRAPGCEQPPHRCQLDHVQRYNHEDPAHGGPTSVTNLHLLCPRHHKQKTAGQWDVTLYPDGTEIWTSHGDGHTVTTVASGPLARETFQQRCVRKTRNRQWLHGQSNFGGDGQDHQADDNVDTGPYTWTGQIGGECTGAEA